MATPALIRAIDGKSKPPIARGRVETADEGQKGKPRMSCTRFMISWSSLTASACKIGCRDNKARHREMMFCETILRIRVKGVRNEKAGKEKELMTSASSR